jgi:hypothetical protein
MNSLTIKTYLHGALITANKALWLKLRTDGGIMKVMTFAVEEPLWPESLLGNDWYLNYDIRYPKDENHDTYMVVGRSTSAWTVPAGDTSPDKWNNDEDDEGPERGP